MKPDRVVVGVEPETRAAAERDARALRAVHTDRRADHDHGHGQRRAVQVRGELDSRDAHLVHERDRQRVRAGGRRRGPGAAGPSARTGGSASSFLFPGVGYGGSCFPKDVKALVRVGARIAATTSGFCRRSRKSTSARRRGWCARWRSTSGIFAAARSRSGGSRSSRAPTTCAKLPPSTSSRRCSPGARGSRPMIPRRRPRPVGSSAIGSPSASKSYDALAGADALAVVTEWNEFREPDFKRMRELLRAPVVFDGRNIYSPEHMRALGFTYFSIGR